MTRRTLALLGACLALGGGWTTVEAQQPKTAPAKGAQAPGATTKTATPPTARPAASPAADEAAIKAMLQEYAKAYNAGQADTLAGLMTDDVELVDGDGNSTKGRKDVTGQFAAVFAEGAPATLKANVEGLRFVTADVAQVAGQFQLGEDDAPVNAGRFSILVVRRDGRWRIAELRDYPIASGGDAGSNYEQLKDLEWMVGDWINEGGDAKITSSVKWALNKNYLVRDYSIESADEPAMTGVMYLGWDAQAKQIKSWVFDSEGGHGQAYWTRANDTQWIIKAQGSLRDGSTTSATQVLTMVNKDAVKQSSLDRIIGGEVAADINEIVMVRKAAAPGR